MATNPPRVKVQSVSNNGEKGFVAACRGGCGTHGGTWYGKKHWAGKGFFSDPAKARREANADAKAHRAQKGFTP
jgi:hypothetical protein